MIVIYSQDKTYIEENIENAKNILVEIYGIKLGSEAYSKLVNASIGTSYRKNGGPLVEVIDKEKAEWIKKKETQLGLM